MDVDRVTVGVDAHLVSHCDRVLHSFEVFEERAARGGEDDAIAEVHMADLGVEA